MITKFLGMFLILGGISGVIGGNFIFGIIFIGLGLLAFKDNK